MNKNTDTFEETFETLENLEKNINEDLEKFEEELKKNEEEFEGEEF